MSWSTTSLLYNEGLLPMGILTFAHDEAPPAGAETECGIGPGVRSIAVHLSVVQKNLVVERVDARSHRKSNSREARPARLEVQLCFSGPRIRSS